MGYGDGDDSRRDGSVRASAQGLSQGDLYHSRFGAGEGGGDGSGGCADGCGEVWEGDGVCRGRSVDLQRVCGQAESTAGGVRRLCCGDRSGGVGGSADEVNTRQRRKQQKQQKQKQILRLPRRMTTKKTDARTCCRSSRGRRPGTFGGPPPGS